VTELEAVEKSCHEKQHRRQRIETDWMLEVVVQHSTLRMPNVEKG
jgi:hypothetical protein